MMPTEINRGWHCLNLVGAQELSFHCHSQDSHFSRPHANGLCGTALKKSRVGPAKQDAQAAQLCDGVLSKYANAQTGVDGGGKSLRFWIES